MNAPMHVRVRVCCQTLVPNSSLDLSVNRKQMTIKDSCTLEPPSHSQSLSNPRPCSNSSYVSSEPSFNACLYMCLSSHDSTSSTPRPSPPVPRSSLFLIRMYHGCLPQSPPPSSGTSSLCTSLLIRNHIVRPLSF